MCLFARLKTLSRGLIFIFVILLAACGAAPSGPIPTDTPGRASTAMVVTVAKANTLVSATQIPIASSLTETPVRVSSVTSVKTSAPNTKTPIPRSPTSLAAQVDCKKTLVGGRTPKIPKITLTILIACRPQVNDTLKAIGTGKFSYSQDDQTFGNFEAYLPNAARGIYREYTVVTPSEGDRGARRLITSGDSSRKPAAYNTLYYTDDHYDTFWQVVTRN